jgi:hypothetical protein
MVRGCPVGVNGMSILDTVDVATTVTTLSSVIIHVSVGQVIVS